MNRIIRYFPNSDLRAAHQGLSKAARENGVDLNKINIGEFLLFVNRKQTMFKMLTQSGMLVSYRSEHRLNPGIFVLVPKYFSGSTFNYTGALREALTRDFPGMKANKVLPKPQPEVRA